MLTGTEARYEFVAYRDGTAAEGEVTIEICTDLTAAKRMAGKICKKINGPVDLAYAGSGEWDTRYISTAQPRMFIGGYETIRLD